MMMIKNELKLLVDNNARYAMKPIVTTHPGTLFNH